jgi:hypothetical protein
MGSDVIAAAVCCAIFLAVAVVIDRWACIHIPADSLSSKESPSHTHINNEGDQS